MGDFSELNKQVRRLVTLRGTPQWDEAKLTVLASSEPLIATCLSGRVYPPDGGWGMEDVANRVRLHLWRSLDKYDPSKASWSTWAYGIARKQVMTEQATLGTTIRMRRKDYTAGRRPHCLSLDDLPAGDVAPLADRLDDPTGSDPFDACAEIDDINHLRARLAGLGLARNEARAVLSRTSVDVLSKQFDNAMRRVRGKAGDSTNGIRPGPVGNRGWHYTGKRMDRLRLRLAKEDELRKAILDGLPMSTIERSKMDRYLNGEAGDLCNTADDLLDRVRQWRQGVVPRLKVTARLPQPERQARYSMMASRFLEGSTGRRLLSLVATGVELREAAKAVGITLNVARGLVTTGERLCGFGTWSPTGCKTRLSAPAKARRQLELQRMRLWSTFATSDEKRSWLEDISTGMSYLAVAGKHGIDKRKVVIAVAVARRRCERASQ